MKEIVAVVFGFGLLCNALLFVPQVLAVWRKKTDEGISLITFGGFSVLQVIGVVHGVLSKGSLPHRGDGGELSELRVSHGTHYLLPDATA